MSTPSLSLQLAPQPSAPPAPAVQLIRASLEALSARMGQTLPATVLGTDANGLTQLKLGDAVVTVRFAQPPAPGTALQVRVQPSPTGEPMLVVEARAAAAAPVAAPAMPRTAPLPLPAAPPPAPAAPAATGAAATAPVAAQSPAGLPNAAVPAGAPAKTPLPSAPATSFAAAPAAPAKSAPPVVATAAATTTSVPQQGAPAAPPAPAGTGGPAPSAGVATTGPVATLAATAISAPAPAVPGAPAVVPNGGAVTTNTTSTALPVAPPAIVGSPITAAPAPAGTGQTPQLAPAAAASPAATPATAAAGQPPALAPASMPSNATGSASGGPAGASTPAAAPARPAAMPLSLSSPAQAAARQDSLAPLLQNLAALQGRLATFPTPVAEAALRLLASRVNLDGGPPSAAALKQAVERAGVLAQPASRPGALPMDMKAALLQLRGGLLALLGSGEIAPVAPVARRPPPPLRDASPRAVRADAPTLSDASTPREAGRTLLHQTDAALSRLKLTQLASQPADAARAAAAAPDFMVELPVMLGHEMSLAQLRIARDGRNRSKPGERGWRVRFAVSFSVIGEVGAQVSLMGRTANVLVWADTAATADALEAMLPELAPALAARGLEVGAVRLRRGPPRDESPALGRLMDTTK